MRDADQLIAGALRDIAAEAGLPGPVADAAWRAGRRRRLAVLAASAASVAGAIVLALAVVLPLTAARGPAGLPRSRSRRSRRPARAYWLPPPGSWASAPHICTCRPPRPRSPGRTSC